MPGAPRFTQKPSIQQTAQGDLLMECHLEADPQPTVKWHHAGQQLSASRRVVFSLDPLGGNNYKATLVIKEPNANDGGAYKCTALNQLGESNANINLNFAGTDEKKKEGPTFVGKPRIIPKDGGALILMECKVRSSSRPVAKWSKDGTSVTNGATMQDVFADLGDGTFLCQLEIRRPTAAEAGQYRCNIRNDQGETNANLSLNFQQEEPGSRPETPSSKKNREGTPSRRHKSKSREGSPRKSIHSRTSTPTPDEELAAGRKLSGGAGNSLQPEAAGRKSSRSDESQSTVTKRKEKDEKKDETTKKRRESSRSKSPNVPTAGADAHKRAPVVTQPLKSQVIRNGERIVLQCELQCHSSTHIVWSKDETVIRNSSEYVSSFDGRLARLEICRSTAAHSGLYKCTAKSDYGEAQSSAMLKHEAGEEEKPERRKSSQKDAETVVAKRKSAAGQEEEQVVPEKQRIHFPDELADADDIPASGLQISAERRKELLKMSGGTDSLASEDDDVSESISEAVPAKSALKKKTTSSFAGSSKGTFEDVDGDKQKPRGQAGRLGSRQGRQVGQQRNLQPFQEVQLKKSKNSLSIHLETPELRAVSGSPELDEARNSVSSANRRGTLLTPEFERRDPTALDRWTASPTAMRRRSSVHMRRESLADVLDKPTTPLKPIGKVGTPARIVEIPENVTVVENELAILKCVVEGNPAPTFTWIRNGREVMSGGRVRYTTDGDAGLISLIIGKCRAPDEGEYLLTVKNEYGTDSVEVKLLVTSESALDFRSMLKKRESRTSVFDKSEADDATAANTERRQSLFPGKRVEKWDKPLPEKTSFQQQVHRVAELKCTYSRPNAKIRWYKDRKEIFSGGLKYKIVINKAEITLVINNPDQDDSGKYTCEANGVPTHCLVTIEEPPMKYVFINPLPNTQEVYHTKQGVLSCKVNSARAPLVWHRGGKPIDVNDGRYIIEKDAVGRFTLTIKKVEQMDQAEWMAKINNDVYSKVMVYVEEPRDTFVVPLKSQRALERESATFECDVNDKDVAVEWWHDGVKITSDARRKEESAGRRRRLIISQVKLEDHGEYKCTTKDDRTMAQLIVEALNKFIVRLEDIEVFEKDDVFLRCETKDTKTPGNWFRRGKGISSMPGGKFEMQSRGGVHTMKISKIEMVEADTYGIDVAGLRGDCRVKVLEAEKKPQITWKPKKFECEAGKAKKIKVPFQVKGTRRGDPKPILLRNGKPVDLEKMKDFVEVVINGDDAEIIFKNPQKTDTGKWALELQNTGGSSGPASFELFVKDRPKVPKGPLETTDVTADSCELKWKPADPDEAAPTRGYIVEMQEGRSGKWKKIGETKNTEFQVNDLKEHGEYKFRVKAVNDIGESDPLTGETILAKNPYTVPGKPKHMEAADISADALTLQWQPPDFDGGAPVESYIVERRDKSDKEWNVVGHIDAKPEDTHQIVDDKVVEGKEYYYRVRAVNKAGPGDPCDHGKPHKIVAKPSPPSFSGGGLEDLYLKVGETIKYDIAIAGEPLPTATWTVNGKPLKAGGRVKMSTERGKTILKIENAVRSDSGRFTLQLKNKSGQVEASANVTVVGRPSPPKGPLDVSDINSKGATLAWYPPEDDGGEPLLEYIVEAHDIDEKGKFVPIGKVPAGQTQLVVNGLKDKSNYKFRVRAVNKEGESEPLASDKHYQIKNPWDEPGKPGRPQVTSVDADRVTLEWEPPMKDGGAPIEEYIVEMKDPHTKEWVSVTTSKEPKATVTGLTKDKEYQFRVRAKNKAGVGAPSEPCDKVITEPKFIPAWMDHGALQNLILKAGQTARWNVAFGGKPAPDVQWFKNQNAIEMNASLQIDTKKNDHTILCIPSCVRADQGAYSLLVCNSHGEAKECADLTVVDRPSKPRGPLEVSNMTEDSCDLSWRPPEDDGGQPIDYYEIEKLDVETGRWVPAAKVKDCKAAVKGLKKGQTYQFRVKAVNKEGISDSLTTDTGVVAKNPYDEPGKCGAPEIVDWDANRADLQWEPPVSDGGAPITNYIVEKKTKHGRDWQECAEVGADCAATVTGLKEGEVYQFRVRAVNKAGPGEPSDPSQRLLAKARFQKPHIDRSAMQKVTIKVGQNVDFKVPVSGEPPPACVWTFKDKPIDPNDPKIRVSNEDYKTHFALRNATRNHAGVYTVTATNDSGTDTHGVEVIVLGRPLPPGGPLEVSDVLADSATLSWRPPEDDGGVPIDEYELEKMDLATGRWVPCGRTKDTNFRVEGLTPGHEYQFRVRAMNKEGESDPLTTKDPTLAKNPFEVPDKIDRPDVVDWDKDHVDLEWKTPNDGGAPIEEFIIEKRTEGGRWVEAERVPTGTTKATIGRLKHGEEYQFRIIAKNRAGPGEPSDPSVAVVAKPRFLAPYIHREDFEDTSIKVGGQLKFNVHVDGEPAPHVVWTFLSNEAVPDGVSQNNDQDYFSRLSIAKATRQQSGTYTITASNNSGTDSVTVQITVKGRPSKPKGPIAVSDVHEDRMKLDWQPPEDDGGVPINYYEVERMDERDGIWVPVGHADTTHFVVDRLKKGSKYQFRVKAVNSEGKSDPLETEEATIAKNPYEHPDKPTPPEVVDWDSDHIDLKWEAPADGGAPIEEYQIEKRTKYGHWEPALSVAGDVTAGTVSGLTKGEEYEFRVTAVNKGGPSEPSDPSTAVVAKPRNLTPKISPLQPLCIRVGQAIAFDTTVEGEPEPEISWFWPSGQEICAGAHVKLENEDYCTRLHIRGTDRSHTGVYTVTAENVNGKDTVRVDVTVLDKPGAPEGPLNVTDVHADRVTLDWKPPLDDGGEPIESYVIEKFDTVNGRWVPAIRISGDDATKCIVDGLVPGHEYKFRVSAVNAEGQSEPLETEQKVVAKEPYDPPGKSDRPEVVDWGKDHADLKWQPPNDDGGASIEEYIVEVKEKFASQWKPMLIVPAGVDASAPVAATVEGLTPGEQYEFRVVAKNKAGKGQPSDPSDMITTKDRHVPPLIDRSAIEEIRVRAGQSFALDIPVAGEEPPEIVWDFEGRPLHSDDRLKINNETEHRTKFVVKRALRSDTGTFNITATNTSGKDVAEVKLIVLDRPGDPQGPLQISNVHKTGCTLDWRPPEDDGGAGISRYMVEKQDLANGRWVPVGESPTTKLEVNDLTPGHEYKFRVKAVNKYGESDSLEATKSIVAKDPFDTADRPGTPEITDWDKDFADIKWTAPTDDGGAALEKYVVEQKTSGGDWGYATEVPADKLDAHIENLIPGKMYQFRIKAVNKAGESAPSDPSRSLLAKARRLSPKIDRQMMSDVRVKRDEKINFNVNVDGEPNPKCQWFINGTPLTTSQRTKVDNSIKNNTKLATRLAERIDSGRYKLVASNEHGTDEYEVNVVVMDVPGEPKGPLDAFEVTKDSASVKWYAPDDDGGSPITHYVVEKQEDGGRWVPCGESPDTSLRVNKLNEGHDYKFRVKAVNRQGESKYLTSDVPVTAKNPWEEPGKPQDVEVIDWDKDHMHLKWRPPISDGGALIDSYIIEKKDKHGDWTPCATVPGDQTTGTADGLIPNETYQFRVIAVNKAGLGEPSDPTDPKMAKPRKLAPKINLGTLTDIRVRASQPFSLNVEYEGEPEPTATWTIDDRSFTGDDHASLETCDHTSHVSVASSVRADSGVYGITVRNEYGIDSAKCTVTVLDVPDVPQGPLEPTDIYKQGCTLHWRPPLDNGGMEISHYIVEKMNMSRGSWAEVGHFADCKAKVTKLTPLKSYLFRVKAVNLIGESKPLESDSEIVAKNMFDVPTAPDAPEVVDWDENRVDIAWKPPANDGGSPVRKYIVEKREKGSSVWLPVGHTPGTSFSITGLKRHMEYEFRVSAVNDAGESPPSAPSIAQMTRARFLAPKILTPQRRFKIRAGLSMTLDVQFVGAPDPAVHWQLQQIGSLAPELIVDAARPGATSIFFPSAKRSESGNYQLNLKNEVGEDEGIFEVLIQDRPSPPKGPLTVDDITKESCSLAWSLPEDDGGSEITNYVVERRDIHTNAWVPVASFVAGTSTTVLKLHEGHEYEFRVSAENALGRSDSLMTDRSVLIKDPFGTPGKPGRPTITDHDVDHIDLAWETPRDDGGSPISHYDIERKDQKTGRWIKVNTSPVYGTSYSDDRVQQGHAYEYRVCAVNKSGPGAFSDPSETAWARPKNLTPQLELDIDGKEIRVRCGDPIDLTIPYVGAPQPEIVWTKDGNTLSGIETNSTTTRLYVSKSRRDDSGQCRIVATNASGRAEARVLILVVDRPGPPEGPVTYPATTRRSVTVAWKPPKDDGGAEIIGYHIEYQEVGGSLDWERAAESTTLLSHMVRNLEHRKQYRFRIFAENLIGRSEPLNGDPVIAKDSFDPPGAPGTPEVTGYDTNMIALKWTPPRVDGGSPIFHYVIERHEKRGGGDWAPVPGLGPVHGTSANVTGLAEGETYQFRVCAVNAAGQGPPSRSCEPVTCRPFIAPPDVVDHLRILRVTKTTVGLSWMRPAFDGGAPIDGYLIEYRKVDESSDWQRATSKPVRDLQYTVDGLEEKQRYEFRVIAVNKAGESDPSKPSDIVFTEDQPGRPILDLSGLKDIVVRAGETITFTIPYTSGGLKPTIDAFNGSSAIYEDNRTTIDVDNERIVFTTTASVRADGGPYKLVVQNRCGRDFAKLYVTVLDVPGRPTGPIMHSELSGEAVTLHWSPPKDDGGSEIINYVVERRVAGSDNFERVGQPVSTNFRVRGLNNGTKYDFRIRAENQYGVGVPLDTNNSILVKNAYDPLGPPGIPEPLTTSHDSITLQWSRPLHDGGAPILGYVLEKRLVGKPGWERAVFGNVPDTRCRVTGLQFQQAYEFRVAAINAAGQGEYSEGSAATVAAPNASRPIISMGMLARDVIAFVGKPGKILVPYAASPRPEVIWNKNGVTLDERDHRAQVETDDFLSVLTYQKCERGDSGTYRIRMENDYGSDSIDVRFKVVNRPSPPEDPLLADDIGPESCQLSWKPPKDDGGSPITNYVVEKYRLGIDAWEKVSSFARNTDCLVMGLVENERYRFRVFAENQYGISEPLEMTDPIVAKYQFSVPDQPDKPTVIDMDRNWAELSWDEPGNGVSRIFGYNLQYRDQHSHKWITANKELISGTSYRATALRDLGEYEFRVVAKNAAGWSKPSPPSDKVQLRQRRGPPGPPQQIHAESIGANWVTLTWSPPIDDGGLKISGYVVEKREIGLNSWEMANDYNVKTPEFTVPNLKEYHDYEFRIIAINAHGRGVPSLPTGPIKIQEMAGSRPMIVVKPADVTCPYNKRAVFTCEAIGRPTPTARWLKNGREVPEGFRYRVESPQEGVYKFIIKEVWDVDAGDYTCEVSNVFGIDTGQATLKVQAPPVIEKQVPNQVHPDGDMVRIKIYFSGSAPFTHRLTLNGAELSPNGVIRVVDFDDHLLITIPELHNQESGRYEYQISNESGEASTGFWINVSGLPSAPEGPLQVNDVNEHQATVSWRAPINDGGSRITNYILERRDTIRDEWTVIASAVRELSFIASGLFPQHSYDFRVSACNANGQGPPLLSVGPTVAQLPYGVPGVPLNAAIVDVSADCVILSWQRPDRDGGGRLRGYMVEKRESNTDYWQKCTQAPSSSTSLNVNNLIEGRKYDLRVVAVNDAGESEPALIENYEFKPASKGEAPEFLVQLSNQHGVQGGMVTFECEVAGRPRPTISWFRGSKELVDTSKFTLIDKGAKQVLIINNLHAEDEDEYTCRAVNPLGSRATRAQLKLSTKPRILLPPRYNLGVAVENSKSLELRIPYKAHPECTASWYKDDEKIEHGSKYNIIIDDRTVTLRINETERGDAGEYRVQIHNSCGNDSATVCVVVNDRPEPPRFLNVENLLDEAAVISWKPPKLDGGSLLTNYIVEKFEVAEGRWTHAAKSRYTYITVEKLIPDHSYQFRVSAENKHGVSDPCDPTVPVTIPASRLHRSPTVFIDHHGRDYGNGGSSLARSSTTALDISRSGSSSNLAARYVGGLQEPGYSTVLDTQFLRPGPTFSSDYSRRRSYTPSLLPSSMNCSSSLIRGLRR